MPTIPWSQPGMTMPAPSWNVNGWAPRSHEASNCWPVDHELPTYCMLSSSPAFAFGPLPGTMSRITSSGGGSPCGAGISGLDFVSLPIACTIASTPASEAVSVGVGRGGGLGAAAGRRLVVLAAGGDPRREHEGESQGDQLRTHRQATELPGRDSNPNYQSQNLACCQLHHPARGGAQYRRADRPRAVTGSVR